MNVSHVFFMPDDYMAPDSLVCRKCLFCIVLMGLSQRK